MSEQKKPSAWGSREIIVLAFLFFVFGVFAVLERPKFVTGSPPSQASICINNLRQIDEAKNSWVLEHNLTNGASLAADQLTNYFREGEMPACPSGGIYSVGIVGKVPTCSLGTTVTPAHALP